MVCPLLIKSVLLPHMSTETSSRHPTSRVARRNARALGPRLHTISRVSYGRARSACGDGHGQRTRGRMEPTSSRTMGMRVCERKDDGYKDDDNDDEDRDNCKNIPWRPRTAAADRLRACVVDIRAGSDMLPLL